MKTYEGYSAELRLELGRVRMVFCTGGPLPYAYRRALPTIAANERRRRRVRYRDSSPSVPTPQAFADYLRRINVEPIAALSLAMRRARFAALAARFERHPWMVVPCSDCGIGCRPVMPLGCFCVKCHAARL